MFGEVRQTLCVTEYNLDSLGWYQFERLCQTLLKSELGIGVAAWGGRGDHGRDAYCEQPLRFPDRATESVGPFIFQAKFVERANAAGAEFFDRLQAAIRAELRQIDIRRGDGLWDEPAHYVLLTNAPVSADQRRDAADLLHGDLPDSEVTVLGASDFDAMLDASPRVRLAYPQLLGVRDLEALLENTVNADVRTRSMITIGRAQEVAATFVATSAYQRTLTIASNFGFAILTGPPEMGKTTIARMIALARHAEGWGYYECRTPDEFLSAYRKDERQVFIADDAFGSTEYRPERASEWAEELAPILRAVDHGHWLLLTSRPAPLTEALKRLRFQDEASEFPDPGKVQVNAADLSIEEKAQMLYRHGKAGTDQAGRDLLRNIAEDLVGHSAFTPLRIANFVRQTLPTLAGAEPEEQFGLAERAVAVEMAEPTRDLWASFGALSADQQRLLISMLDAPDRGAGMSELDQALRRHTAGLPAESAEEIARQIDGHFIQVGPGWD